MKLRTILMCMAIGLGISAANAYAQPDLPRGLNIANLTPKQMKELAVEQTDMMKEALELDAAQYNKVLKLNLNRIKVLRNTAASGFGGMGMGMPMGGRGGFGGPGGFRPGMGGPMGGPGMGQGMPPAGASEVIEELTKEQKQYEQKISKILNLQQLRKFQANRRMGSIRREPAEMPEGARPGMGGPGMGPGGRPGNGGPGMGPGGRPGNGGPGMGPGGRPGNGGPGMGPGGRPGNGGPGQTGPGNGQGNAAPDNGQGNGQTNL